MCIPIMINNMNLGLTSSQVQSRSHLILLYTQAEPSSTELAIISSQVGLETSSIRLIYTTIKLELSSIEPYRARDEPNSDL